MAVEVGEVRTAIWDFDGTMIDSVGIYRDVLGEIAPRHGFEMPDDETIRRNYHGSLDDSIAGALAIGDEDLVAEMVADFQATQDKHYHGDIEVHFFKDALRLAKKLQEAQHPYQAVLTNRKHANQLNASPRTIIERSSLESIIKQVICHDDCAHRKPDPRAVEELASRGLIVPELTVIFGDQFVDAKLAHNIGARAVIVCREGEEPAHMDQLDNGWEDHVTVVKSFDEVIA